MKLTSRKFTPAGRLLGGRVHLSHTHGYKLGEQLQCGGAGGKATANSVDASLRCTTTVLRTPSLQSESASLVAVAQRDPWTPPGDTVGGYCRGTPQGDTAGGSCRGILEGEDTEVRVKGSHQTRTKSGRIWHPALTTPRSTRVRGGCGPAHP